MALTNLVFYLLSVLAVGAALMMLLTKSPVHSVLWLVVVFFAISGHYVLMNAQFLAVVNMIVYAGAIMVLFLFVVMLMNLDKDAEPVRSIRMRLIGIISGGSLMLVFLSAVMKLDTEQPVQLKLGDEGLVSNLGRTLFDHYVVPFELSSVLFLTALLGAVIMGKKES